MCCITKDSWNHCIRSIDLATGVTTTLAGTGGASGGWDGPSARFKHPWGVAIDPSGTFALVGVRHGPRTHYVPTSAHPA